ncbi:protein FAM216A isoform X2 [Tachysurus ichikawai]
MTSKAQSVDVRSSERERTGYLQSPHFNTIDIPNAMLAAPFLQYSDLTPGQKRYLCSVCKAYSEAHMRKLMQQHYLNVLRRSMRGGNVISNIQLRMFLPALGHSSTQEKERSEGKVQEQKDKNGSKKMIVLPKINSQQQSICNKPRLQAVVEEGTRRNTS